ncbi:DNA polymerase III subunit gamma/tau [Thermodesulfobacteriota bacterium]
MSYLVLARKYRPQTFEQVIKQEHVTQTLTNAISAGRVAHAILFSGPRGTGKTTVARILAKAMNCQEGPTPAPCNDCRSCREITAGSAVDVFEIDGASNNSVDQIRELRENIKYMPANSPYKIYIIDEVHMLSIAAFNALLKTLEEPPPHVLFFFATTEPHKIPITILSRCQRHDFRRIDAESIGKHMVVICQKEGVRIDPESLWLIAREAGGSMRDALSLLDQIMNCAEESISPDLVLNLLGGIDGKLLFDMSAAILAADIPRLLDILDDIYTRGHDLKKLFEGLLEHFRNMLVVKIGENVEKLVDLPSHEIDQIRDQVKDVSEIFLNQIFDNFFREEGAIRLSDQPKLVLEMAFVRLLQIRPALSIEVLIEKLDRLKNEFMEPREKELAFTHGPIEESVSKPALPQNKGAMPLGKNDAAAPPEAQTTPALKTRPSSQPLDDTWKMLVNKISQGHPALAAHLSKCTLNKLTDQSLEIEVAGNDFALNMIKKNKNLAILGKVCEECFHKKMDLIFNPSENRNNNARQEKSRDDRLKKKALNHPLVTDALEIFDGQVVDVKIVQEVIE